jgi:hypothetical protein
MRRLRASPVDNRIMNVSRWIIASLLFAYYLGIAATNAITILRYFRRGDKGSLLPIFGGLAGFLALLVVPLNGAWMWCWLPIVFDFWTLPSILSWVRGGGSSGSDHKR